ncbi:hypothetical protein, partial [Calditerricola satsumensis]|uniref:hypothetical protein n=1 Tax=Calditerricola satsumensis TaxID=373054 RepID=UPI001C4528E4
LHDRSPAAERACAGCSGRPPVVRDLPADQEPQPEENAPFHRVEQLARERPEEFVKLLRAWLSEE